MKDFAVRARFALFLAAALMGGCATGITPASKAGSAAPPKGEVLLGDYAKANDATLAKDFAAHIAGRYGAGLPMNLALADLGRSKFTCGAPKAASKGSPGGDPPDQVCRRAIAAAGCTHTWQVHLFDDDGGKQTVARVRGLYDKACGADDLLGN